MLKFEAESRDQQEPKTKVDLQIPYYSQQEEDALNLYGRKACGLTSLRMVLAYYGYNFGINEMSDRAKLVGAYSEEDGWIHSGLVDIARQAHHRIGPTGSLDGIDTNKPSLHGFRINFDFLKDEDLAKVGPILAREGATQEEIEKFTQIFQTAREKGIKEAIDQLIDQEIPVIASMRPTYAKTSATHLVVIKGKENGNYILNDPWVNSEGNGGKAYPVPVEKFNEDWTHRAIVIYPSQVE